MKPSSDHRVRGASLVIESRPNPAEDLGALRYRLECVHGQSSGAYIPAVRPLSRAIVMDVLVWRHRVTWKCECGPTVQPGFFPGDPAVAH